MNEITKYEQFKELIFSLFRQIKIRLVAVAAISIVATLIAVFSYARTLGNGVVSAPSDIKEIIENDTAQFRFFRIKIIDNEKNTQTILDNQDIMSGQLSHGIVQKDSIIYLVNLLIQKVDFMEQIMIINTKKIDRNTVIIDRINQKQ